MTLAEYDAAPATKKAQIAQERGWRIHRGTPIPRAIEGYRLEMRHQAGRKPTHRGEPRPENIPPWVHMLQAHADQAERNRDA